MDKIDDPNAFPMFLSDKFINATTPDQAKNAAIAMHGMSLGDYYAGQAMQALLPVSVSGDIRRVAMLAFKTSKIMLEERAKANGKLAN